jgi:hypothetical protein
LHVKNAISDEYFSHRRLLICSSTDNISFVVFASILFNHSLQLKVYNSVEREYNGIIRELDKFQCEYVLSNARVALHGSDNEDHL